MPPKTKFSKEDVIQAAFELLESDCLDCLTARNIGKKLGSSTAPVYTYFDTIKDLEKVVITKARDLLLEYTTRQYTDRLFLNMGIGIAVFAREHPNLYHALFMERSDFKEIIHEFHEIMAVNLREDQRLVCLKESERKALLYKMGVFTHGLASFICIGLIKDNSDKFIVGILEDVGMAVIKDTLAKSGKQNHNTNDIC